MEKSELRPEFKRLMLKYVLGVMENGGCSDGMCTHVDNFTKEVCIDSDLRAKYKEWFQTLKPKDSHSVYWFPTNEKGRKQRIKFLKRNIALLDEEIRSAGCQPVKIDTSRLGKMAQKLREIDLLSALNPHKFDAIRYRGFPNTVYGNWFEAELPINYNKIDADGDMFLPGSINDLRAKQREEDKPSVKIKNTTIPKDPEVNNTKVVNSITHDGFKVVTDTNSISYPYRIGTDVAHTSFEVAKGTNPVPSIFHGLSNSASTEINKRFAKEHAEFISWCFNNSTEILKRMKAEPEKKEGSGFYLGCKVHIKRKPYWRSGKEGNFIGPTTDNARSVVIFPNEGLAVVDNKDLHLGPL